MPVLLPLRPTVRRRVRLRVLHIVASARLFALLATAAANLGPMRDLLENGHYNAAAQLEGPNLIERFPADPEAHFLYARATWLTGDLDTARKMLDRALMLSETSPPDYVHLNGLLRAEEGDVIGSLRSLENAFLRSRRFEHAMDWGMVAWRTGEFEVALTAYERASDTDEGARSPWPHLNRGRLLARIGRTDAATRAFETAIEVFEASDPGGARPPSPAYVEAFYQLGRLREAAGDLVQAEQDYKAARSIDPNYTPAIQALDDLTRRLE
ncbi:MAG: tetratricopeptide repeat protein [Trueperaceae bacterium]